MTYSDDSVATKILASKTRISPLKAQTIPRLELLSELILSRLVTTMDLIPYSRVPLILFYVLYTLDSLS